MRLTRPRELPLQSAAEIRARLKGQFTYDLFGFTLTARHLPYTVKGVALGRMAARMRIVRDTVEAYKVMWRPVIEPQVDDWDGCNWDDLWADPEKGFAFCRQVMGK